MKKVRMLLGLIMVSAFILSLGSLPSMAADTVKVGIVGGVATIMGPAVGAFVMVGVQETFRSAFFGAAPKWISQAHALVFGLLVIVVIMFLANGIVGDWSKIKRNVFRIKESN